MMPRLKNRTPAYRLHKATGQAVVSLDGQDYYLGKHDTKASREEYDRLIAEWLAGNRSLNGSQKSSSGLTVVELLATYLRHAETYYVSNGRVTKEIEAFKQAVRPLRRLYGTTRVNDFGPLKLKAVRQAFIDSDLSRKVVNRQVQRIRQVFKWGTENELVPASVYHGLQAISGLRRGRTTARETSPVVPVPDEFVDAVKPFVSRQVWAIIELQRLTGMRPGEVRIMRSRDLDTTGKVWIYHPESRKSEHHGYKRVVELGPRSQALIGPFLKPDIDAYLFSPMDAEAERREKLSKNRKTPMSCGNRPGTNRKRKPRRTPKDQYTTDSYRRAVTRGCDLADEAAKRERGLPPDADRIIPHWHPHQLRHNCATKVTREYGIENARIMLGHRNAFTTEIYAEVDRAKAREIAAKIG